MAARLLRACRRPPLPAGATLADLTPKFFVAIIEDLFQTRLELPHVTKAGDCQAAIDYLADEVLDTSLDHIRGQAVAAGEPQAVHNLVEILHELLKLLTHQPDLCQHLDSSYALEPEAGATAEAGSARQPAAAVEEVVSGWREPLPRPASRPAARSAARPATRPPPTSTRVADDSDSDTFSARSSDAADRTFPEQQPATSSDRRQSFLAWLADHDPAADGAAASTVTTSTAITDDDGANVDTEEDDYELHAHPRSRHPQPRSQPRRPRPAAELRRKASNAETRARVLRQVLDATQPPKASAGRQRGRVGAGARKGPVRSSHTAAPPLDLPDVDLPTALPHMPVSDHTKNHLWEKYRRQMQAVTRNTLSASRRPQPMSEVERLQRRQAAERKAIQKEAAASARLHEQREQQQRQREVASRLREQRQAKARLRRYYESFHVAQRGRQLKRRTREELVFKKMFEELLDEYRERARAMQKYTKEQQAARQKEHRDALESMENFYRDQIDMMDEELAQQQQSARLQDRSEERALQRLRSDMRARMEREIAQLQDRLVDQDVEVHFRQLDADALLGRG